MTAAQFEASVRDYARFSSMVFIGDHVFVDNADRRLTRRNIIRALTKGTVRGAPTWDAGYQTWVGKMHYLGTGMGLEVVCAIKENVLTVTVVTAYPKAR